MHEHVLVFLHNLKNLIRDQSEMEKIEIFQKNQRPQDEKLKKGSRRKRKSPGLNFRRKKKAKKDRKAESYGGEHFEGSEIVDFLEEEAPTTSSFGGSEAVVSFHEAPSTEMMDVEFEASQEPNIEIIEEEIETPVSLEVLQESVDLLLADVNPGSAEKRIIDLEFYTKNLIEYKCPRSRVCAGTLADAKFVKVLDKTGLLTEVSIECQNCKNRGLLHPPQTLIPTTDATEKPNLNEAVVIATLATGDGFYHQEQFLSTVGIKPMTSKFYLDLFQN